MIPAGDAIEYRRLRAPQVHGGVLIDPPLATVATHLAKNLAANLSLSRGGPCEIFGRPLAELAAAARRELVAQARQYTANYRDVATAEWSPHDDAPIVLTGHQPQLYHPGVWFKSFALSEIARRHGTHAVNLLIDNDTLRAASLRVPTGSPHEPHIATVPFDEPGDEIPFEERTIVDRVCFDSFGERTTAAIAPLVPNPLVSEMWPHAIAAARQSANLGQAVSRARHVCEAGGGLRTLELPLSTVCNSASFRRFALHLLIDAPRLRDVYNSALAEYRRVNRLRSHSHPVPDLASVGDAGGDWHETPFWIWTTAAPRRRQLFVRRGGDRLQLTDRGQVDLRLDVGEAFGAETAIDQLAAAEARGIKLRPRALVTTLYARLVLSELFLHGIGGAKYDQLTDAIIRRFFGLVPPVFLTLTVTALLPVEHPVVTVDDVRRMDHELRDLQFHPETFCTARSDESAARELIENKRHLLAAVPPRGQSHHGERVARFHALQQVNAALQPFVAARRAALLARRPSVQQAAARHALLAAREFSFCLFPQDFLFSQLLDSCHAKP